MTLYINHVTGPLKRAEMVAHQNPGAVFKKFILFCPLSVVFCGPGEFTQAPYYISFVPLSVRNAALFYVTGLFDLKPVL